MAKLSIFSIPKMDCPSEEGLIRLQLDKLSGIRTLNFDLSQRTLAIVHEKEVLQVLEALRPLNFGAKIISTEAFDEDLSVQTTSQSFSHAEEGRVLKQLLAINGTMFFLELGLGFAAESSGLIADSLDMFADAAVYGLSLYAVGKSLGHKQHAARLSGYFQLFLAIFALSEVARRFFFGSEPEGILMMGVSLLALIANVSCLGLLSKHREGAVHMKASWIFSTNDVIANLGVIAAGAAVYFTSSQWPDLVIGTMIAVVVFRGAITILKISSAEANTMQSFNREER